MQEDYVKQIESTISLVDKLVDKYISEPRKSQVESFLNDKGHLYFEAPASSKERYHSSYPGGLAKHSINVYKNLRKLNTAFECGFSEESMLIASLFHDLGKAMSSDLKTPHYLDNVDDWQKKRGINYNYNENEMYMTNHLRSIYILSQAKIDLSAEEFMAIYLNDGQYVQENRPYAMKECALALYLHMADRLACEQESKPKLEDLEE